MVPAGRRRYSIPRRCIYHRARHSRDCSTHASEAGGRVQPQARDAGSAQFINAIEAYHAVYGRYPPSLASVHHDYDPPVIGIERYHYEPSGRAYNVFFEQSTFPIGTQEFVMYNPLDEQAMIVHNLDLLESPEEQVDARAPLPRARSS